MKCLVVITDHVSSTRTEIEAIRGVRSFRSRLDIVYVTCESYRDRTMGIENFRFVFYRPLHATLENELRTFFRVSRAIEAPTLTEGLQWLTTP